MIPDIKFVILWTDALVYLLCVMSIGLIYWGIKKGQLKHALFKLMQSPINMIAIIILCFYVMIGLMDSIHYRVLLSVVNEKKDYTHEVTSLLDNILMPMQKQLEKTYSAPFATHTFVKEMVVNEAGKIEWVQPNLQYGGQHLKAGETKTRDILDRIEKALIASIWVSVTIFSIILFILYHFNVTWREVLYGQTIFPYKTMLLTTVSLLTISMICYSLKDAYHILGTDKVGRDVFYLSIKGIRTGLVIGTLTTLVMLPFAIFLGTLAGYFLGWLDDIIQYIYTTLSSIPGVLLIAAAVLTLQVYMQKFSESFELMIERTDLRLLLLCIILGLTSWTSLCRLLRGETLKLRALDYIEAAKVLGTSHFSIILRHIIPNLSHIILISIALDFSGLVLAEAVLSYVGVGVDPSTYSWGNMINGARMEMAREPVVWWSLAGAFLFMFVLVLAANIFSDAVRDAFDPRIH